MRKLVPVQNVQHIHSDLVTRHFIKLTVLQKIAVSTMHLALGFTEIKSAQQSDHQNVVKMFIIHWLTPVTSFSSTMSMDLLSMQFCFI